MFESGVDIMPRAESKTTAIAASVNLEKRKRIDAAFAEMARDSAYQKETLLISNQFAQSDWDAFEVAEREP